MTNNKILTIIVPMYNVSKYINQCLDSLIKDESILDDLEVLVVNDGSTDDSAEKAKAYVERFPDTVVLINKENGGHGSALNIGIEKATSKYLKALDSDDWVRADGLARLIQFIKTQRVGEEADIILNPSEEIWENSGRIVLRDFEKLKEYKGAFDLKPMVDNKYISFFWNITVRTDLYRENDIPRIDEKISYDDIEYNIYPLPYVKSIRYLPDVIYQYRLGISGQSSHPANNLKRQWMFEQVLDTIYHYRRGGEEARKLTEIKVAMMLNGDLGLYLLWNDQHEAKKKFLDVLGKYSDIPVFRYTGKILKVFIIARYHGFGLLSFLYKKKLALRWKM